MDLEAIDMTQICRTCKCVSPNMWNLFEGYEHLHHCPRIDEMLMACASVQVISGDGLPNKICQSCIEQLKSAFAFKHQCEIIDASLREYAKNMTQSIEFKEELQNSDLSDPLDVDNCFEPQVEIKEGMNEDEVEEIANTSNANYKADDNSKEVKEESEIISVQLEVDEDDNVVVANLDSEEDTNSRCLSKESRSPKIKCGRGRSYKDANTALKLTRTRVLGRNKATPPIKRAKQEEKNEDSGEFSCPICREIFNTISQLNKHTNEEHEDLQAQNSSVLQEKQNELECDICQKQFNRPGRLAKHKAFKHGIGEEILGGKKFVCPLCYKRFSSEKYLENHVNGHNGREGHQCSECEKNYPSKSLLTKHMKSHDEQSKKFLCSECGKKFIRRDYLVIHLRRHNGEKPFKCKFCEKGFPRLTDLNVHERYHTGEKTHLCTICGRGFGRAYDLKVHMRTHTGEKPYQCTYCEAAFAQGNDLKAHVRRHTGERFQCDLCTEKFMVGHLLNQHKRTVHGLNIVSNIARLNPVQKQEVINTDDLPTIPMPFPKRRGRIPDNILFTALSEG